MDEIFIVLLPSLGLHFPRHRYATAKDVRTLEPEVDCESKEGWGDAKVLNKFMRELENSR